MGKVKMSVGDVYIFRVSMQFNVKFESEYRQVAEVEFGLLDDDGVPIKSQFGGPAIVRKVIVLQRSAAPLSSASIVAMLASNKLSSKLEAKLQFVAHAEAGLGEDPGVEQDL